ncbi:MAG: CehA/McbA family metallohydrolase, partial [Deltaproteobacteria bacterium]|nr:CehA/McbA family metallohydrolase [Deltaproteobacteria bacterium]
MERSRFVLNAILLASLMTGCSGSMGDSVSDGTMGETFGDAPDDATADDAVPPPPDAGGDGPGEPGDTTWPDPEVDPGVRMRTSGWMAGDLHLHSQHSDGEDSVAAVIQLAEYLEDPVFLAAHPEYHGNPLDFLSITDHRTVSQQSDPDHHSDRLVLLGGEEYGGPGHACLWGITEHIPHGDTHESYRQGVEAAHAAGGLFSINHPFTAKITFPWDVRTHDALEVVNTRWGVMGPSIAPEFLEAWELEHGPASPFFRKATLFPGIGGNQQALVFYEAQLTLGVHVALVGGSDRHTLFPVGFPTTWVRSEGPDAQGILEGIRRRHTFVSRTPVSATVEVEVT